MRDKEGRAFDDTTLVNTASCTKGVTNICVARLVDQCLLNYGKRPHRHIHLEIYTNIFSLHLTHMSQTNRSLRSARGRSSLHTARAPSHCQICLHTARACITSTPNESKFLLSLSLTHSLTLTPSCSFCLLHTRSSHLICVHRFPFALLTAPIDIKSDAWAEWVAFLASTKPKVFTTPHAYHPVALGFFVSAICYKVTGKTISQYFVDEIQVPFGIE